MGVVGVATSQGDLFTSWCLRWLDTFLIMERFWKGFWLWLIVFVELSPTQSLLYLKKSGCIVCEGEWKWLWVGILSNWAPPDLSEGTFHLPGWWLLSNAYAPPFHLSWRWRLRWWKMKIKTKIFLHDLCPTPITCILFTCHDSYPSLRYLFFSCRHHVDDDVCDHLDNIKDGDDEEALVIITVVKNLNYEKISF